MLGSGASSPGIRPSRRKSITHHGGWGASPRARGIPAVAQGPTPAPGEDPNTEAGACGRSPGQRSPLSYGLPREAHRKPIGFSVPLRKCAELLGTEAEAGRRTPVGPGAGRGALRGQAAEPASPPGAKESPEPAAENYTSQEAARPGPRTRAGAKSAGGWSSGGLAWAPGAGRTPTCWRGARGGRAGSGRRTSARVRGRCGLRAARAPQDRRAAARPPFGPHCIRGKRLRGDVPLLPALPALPGCHRDIASPLHGDRLPRPTCPPTATRGPDERRSGRATSASPGRTTTSVRKARPPAPEWPAPAVGTWSSERHWGRLTSLTPRVRSDWLRRLSVTLRAARARLLPWRSLAATPRASRPCCRPALPRVAGGPRGGPAGRGAGRKEPGDCVPHRPGAGGRARTVGPRLRRRASGPCGSRAQRDREAGAPTLWCRPEPQARGPSFRSAEALGAPSPRKRGRTGDGMAPPSGPGPAAVLLAVQATVRPLGAGPDAEAQLRRLQLSADPERPGRLRLQLLGAGPGAGGSEWPLESVSYTVRGPSRHELQPPPGGPGALSLHFLDARDARRWAALVRRAAMEGRDGSLPQALGPDTCPVSPPSPPEVPTLQTPQPKVDLCWSPGDSPEKEELVGRLARAIEDGDEKGAAQAAALLAQHHVALSVRLREACFPPGPIRLQVTVEDAASSAHVSLQVHPHCTIATLQEQVFSEFGFPPAVQRWVIGQCLCVPERSLASYGVRRDGDPAFLYLLSAPGEASGRSPLGPQKTDGELSRLFPQSLGLPRAPQPASLPSPLQPGWSCPSCTFINAPSRPGCEMCSTQKPCSWDPLPAASTHQPPKVSKREDGLIPPGPRSLEPVLKLSGDFC